MRPATRCGASLLLHRSNLGSSVDSGAWLPVALPGAASTAIVHLRLRMNELRKLSGGKITSCRFDPFAAPSSNDGSCGFGTFKMTRIDVRAKPRAR
jgi:hypothetical protein